MRAPRVYRTPAVVLKRIDFGEADKILTLFTPFRGKLRAIAKGVRRPGSRMGGHLDLLTHSNLLLAHGRNFDIVTQSETLESFIGLREDLWRAGHGYQVAELIDRMTEDGHEDRPTYEALLEALRRIADDPDPELGVRQFEVTLLDRLGYRPQLRGCVVCGRALERVDSYYSPAAGGVLCPTCGPAEPTARPIGANAFAMLRLLQTGDYATARRVRKDEPLRRELEAITHLQIAYVLERELKSTAFVTRLRALAGGLVDG
ncbi:MAG TPA: DNA repair protein RecO [Chloroflexota bacterium]